MNNKGLLCTCCVLDENGFAREWRGLNIKGMAMEEREKLRHESYGFTCCVPAGRRID
jgi:hypothetical protein